MAKLGGKPPTPRRPKAIKVAAPPSADTPVLRDVVARLKNQQRQAAQLDQARSRAKAVGSGRSPSGARSGRVAIPSAEELFGGGSEGSGAYDEALLGGGVDLSTYDTGRDAAQDDTAEEQRARVADRTRYVSPAPTSCEPRPRALEYRYDPQRLVLTVTFRDGGTYEYADVDRRTFYNMARVKSTGRFIDRNIKGYFAYTKIGA